MLGLLNNWQHIICTGPHKSCIVNCKTRVWENHFDDCIFVRKTLNHACVMPVSLCIGLNGLLYDTTFIDQTLGTEFCRKFVYKSNCRGHNCTRRYDNCQLVVFDELLALLNQITSLSKYFAQFAASF